jgi:UDP-N-acetylmuramyl pentapeptide phosphotransferase/UDP-N-acetylglucosamine-1-phosphate transferase
MPPVEFNILWVLALGLAAAVLTWASIAYAHWRGLLDHAGQRRSHAGTVPRGGGVSIILVTVGACALLVAGEWLEDWLLLLRFGLATLMVALIGWIDDHRPLPALARLLVHVVAAGLFVLPMLMPGFDLVALLLAGLALLLLVTAVNFWNFMDGINGIASLQAIFVASVLVHAFAVVGDPGVMLLSLAVAAGCLGFLPFNFPRARIFLGDVGSGGLGFVLGALLLLAVLRGALDVWTALLLPLAFWLDAGMTLGARMLLGRRWYTAHREHLYQWLVRRGRSHPQVDLLFSTWNLLIVLPAYALISTGVLPSLPVLVAVATAGALVWWLARQKLLREARLYGFR